MRPRAGLVMLAAAALSVAGLSSLGGGAARVHAASPGTGTLTLPASGTVSTTWTGTVGPGAGNFGNLVSLRCNPPGLPGHPVDDFKLTLTIPGGATAFYATHSARMTVRIDWTPVTSAAVNDLGLTTSFPSGAPTDFQDSHQVGTTFEQVTIVNPKDGGSYDIGSCPDTNAQNQPYGGSVTIAVTDLTAGGGVTFDNSTTVAYAPASIVSATFLGAEPQTTLERTLAGVSLAGATDPNRIFIDWPLSTRTQIGQLSRSIDGGDSFRLLYDLSCAIRSRPNCLTGGGGDTVNRVNLYDGTVLYGDQEAVVNEALASSIDHGDSFPVTRQFAVSNAATGVDRQWIAPVNAGGVLGGNGIAPGVELRGFYSYHIPAVGEIIQGIDTNGAPIPQAAQLTLVSQSGPSRADVIPGSKGHGYVYQSYRDGSGFEVGVAPIASYQLASAWKVHNVSTDQPSVFPWINLDNQGNLYAVWVTGGNVFYSYSLIADPANDPTATPPGSPGTKWAPEVKINAPSITSTVFPEVVAGDAGRVGVVYYGTTEFSGQSDNAPATTHWDVYTAVMSNGLNPGGPTVATGKVNHRVAHVGNICTQGTTCTGTFDRSLLDMCDIGFDHDGRLGVVFMDNQSTFGDQTGTPPVKGSPFVHFAKEVQGPSLLSANPTVSVTIPNGPRSDPPGDATWPNVSGAANLPALDELDASIGTDSGGTNLVGSIHLNEGTVAAMQRDLAAYNTANGAAGLGNSAQRLQYVLRFATATDIYYLSMDVDATGATRFFGGKLDGSDGITNGTSVLAAGYHTKAGTTVTGSIAGNTITFSTAANTADFASVGSGTAVLSVTGFAMAGPSEATDKAILDTMRTVDATPPYDTVIAPVGGAIPETSSTPLIVATGVLLAMVGALYRRRRRRAVAA